MARDIRAGLTAEPKELAPKYFYDERGSSCLSRSPNSPRTLRPSPSARSSPSAPPEILSAAGEPGTLVELGSGSAAKTRHLLSAMRDAGVWSPTSRCEHLRARSEQRDGAVRWSAEYPQGSRSAAWSVISSGTPSSGSPRPMADALRSPSWGVRWQPLPRRPP